MMPRDTLWAVALASVWLMSGLAIPGRSLAASSWAPSPSSASQASVAADPDRGFLEQYAATNHFALGRPTSITITPHGEAVLYLRSGPRSFVRDLYEFDVSRRRERVLLTAAQILKGSGERLTAEERARRERQRLTARGIASYQLSKDGRRILVPLSGRLFVIERASGSVQELKGHAGFPIDPQFSPDGSKVACVRDDDIYVTDLASGIEHRLTQGATETLTHGVAEFVAQEEMDRFTGYWWSPDGQTIAYQTTDLSPVEMLHIMDPAHPDVAPQSWRYPRPGKPNAIVSLGLILVEGGVTRGVKWDRAQYPYLATVRWDEKAPLTLVVQNRRQTEEAVLAVDERTAATRVLLTERDTAWLNLDQKMPYWLPDGSSFLWTTERAGAWQLELRGHDGRLLRTLTTPELGFRKFVDLDERGHVWVQAGGDPTQRQLYRVPLDPRKGEIEPATSSPGIHDALFSQDGSLYVRLDQRSEGEPTETIVRGDGEMVQTLRSVAEKPRIDVHPDFLTVGARQFHLVRIQPRDFDARRTYPVIVQVYGGPLSQTVTRSRNQYLLDQWIADHGYVVVSIDGRGTPGRGRTWERAIKDNLIALPLEDQIEALRALAVLDRHLDLSRVGIFGWSFGGYFSAHAITRKPDVFRAAVVGAPVVDWHDYDTHYTERYMDLPERNPSGYRASSVLTYVDRLDRPLLIVHGTVDDNVYFLHSMKLCDALFRAGKTFEFVPLAGFTHMVPDPTVTTRLYQRIMEFFGRTLTPQR